MINLEIRNNSLVLNSKISNTEYSTGYYYGICGTILNNRFSLQKPDNIRKYKGDKEILFLIDYCSIGLKILQRFCLFDNYIEETLEFINEGTATIVFDKIDLGFKCNTTGKADWNFTAIPFKIQIDGNVHEYNTNTLLNGKFKNYCNYIKNAEDEMHYGNSVFCDTVVPLFLPLNEEGNLRSEAWAFGTSDNGLLVIKYNNDEIEYSIVGSLKDKNKKPFLTFGGAGFCLYSEPSGAQSLAPNTRYRFGTTIYKTYSENINNAFYAYRNFIEHKGHGYSKNYNPPINWNVLYDLGWSHSNKELLKVRYTNETLLNEAKHARDCGCELLYLDPGWEYCEGTTIWDGCRIGDAAEFIKQVGKEFGLNVGFRTILRTYSNYWPKEYLAQTNKNEQPYMYINANNQCFALEFQELCIANEPFFKEKLKRIMSIVNSGMSFVMMDEMDWRGPCFNENHDHAIPSKPIEHILGIYNIAQDIKRNNPETLIEMHDPIWPWRSCNYVQTYFKQGFDDNGYYHENWGFEFMWNCIDDLITGKALSLYYYNLAVSIPLYLHINMAADNDNCLFFWWAASTVRHLGIGGKTGHKSVELEGALKPHDKEKRFAAYKSNMKTYKSLKKYFVRGKFFGINENIHLHTLEENTGGVVNVFNIVDDTIEVAFSIEKQFLNGTQLKISGASEYQWTNEGVNIKVLVLPHSHALVTIGDSVKELKTNNTMNI